MSTSCPTCGKSVSFGGQLYRCPACDAVSCHRCSDALFAKKCPHCKRKLDKSADRVRG